MKQSLRETLNYLLNSGNNHEHPDSSLSEIEVELEAGGRNSHKVLTRCANKRERISIDLRMNTDPPVYLDMTEVRTIQKFPTLNS
jgi:hypothetical protein